MIRKSIAFQEININSLDGKVELWKIRLTNTKPLIDITVCYRANGNLSQEQWNSIISHINNNHANLIVGDFNSHNLTLNSYKTDSNGEKLANSINDYNLFIYNSNTITRI